VFAALINPKNPYASISTKEAQDAARALGKEIHIVHASSAGRTRLGLRDALAGEGGCAAKTSLGFAIRMSPLSVNRAQN
jgi:hypothetical protein